MIFTSYSMPTVIFMSLDVVTRMATFSVNGVSVEREIASHITDELLEQHLMDLAQGLAIEFSEVSASVEITNATPFTPGEVLITE